MVTDTADTSDPPAPRVLATLVAALIGSVAVLLSAIVAALPAKPL